MNTADVFDSILANDGGTFACRNGIRPAVFTDGYMIALPDKEMIIPVHEFMPQDVAAYIAAENNYVGGIGYYLGAWVHAGMVYLDVSMYEKHQANAEGFGHNWGQLAIWDNANGTEITL